MIKVPKDLNIEVRRPPSCFETTSSRGQQEVPSPTTLAAHVV